MKKWKQMIRNPQQSLSPRTLVEILGRKQVLVEHHRGILRYGTDEIVIGATFGMIQISGEGLRLCCMSREQLFVCGMVRGITLEGSNE